MGVRTADQISRASVCTSVKWSQLRPLVKLQCGAEDLRAKAPVPRHGPSGSSRKLAEGTAHRKVMLACQREVNATKEYMKTIQEVR